MSNRKRTFTEMIASEFTDIEKPSDEMSVLNKAKQVKQLEGLSSESLNRQMASLDTASLEDLVNRGGKVAEIALDYLNQNKKKKAAAENKKKLQNKMKNKMQNKLKFASKLENRKEKKYSYSPTVPPKPF